MSEQAGAPLDMQFVDIYDSAKQHGEDAFEMLRPAFLGLCQGLRDILRGNSSAVAA